MSLRLRELADSTLRLGVEAMIAVGERCGMGSDRAVAAERSVRGALRDCPPEYGP
jgi:hypothetical protein